MANQYDSTAPATPDEMRARRLFVMECRRRGMIYEEIAAKVREKFQRSISPVQCHQDFKTAIQEQTRQFHEDVDACREMALQRLDKALAAISERVEVGSLDHIEAMLKIEARRARLLGIDIPREPPIDKDRPKLTELELLERVAAISARLQARGLPVPQRILARAVEAETVPREDDAE